MFSERKLDNIEREKERFFKKANTKNPDLGGAKKIDYGNQKKDYYNLENLGKFYKIQA